MTNTTPLESVDQKSLVKWLDRQSGVMYSAPAQNTYTKSFKQKRHNFDMGTRPGLADLIIYVSSDASKDGGCYLIWLELKREKGGVVSQAQQDWQDAINSLGVPQAQAYIARGYAEAIKVVSHYLKSPNTSPF